MKGHSFSRIQNVILYKYPRMIGRGLFSRRFVTSVLLLLTLEKILVALPFTV